VTKELRFGEARRYGTRIVREAVFSARPAFSLGALCATANAVAGGFTASLGRRVQVVLGEPAHVEPGRWQRLCAGAWAYGVNETTTWLIDRPSASNVLAAIIGEPPATPPTALEMRALDRFMARVWERASAGSQNSEAPKRLREAPGRSWVVDMRVSGALRATLVIGGSLPPDAPPGPFLGARALGGVPVDVYVEIASGSLLAREVGALAVGDLVRMATKVRDSAMLKVADETIAYGEYGEIEGERGCAARPAFLIRETVR
jgi:hypothetical protein